MGKRVSIKILKYILIYALLLQFIIFGCLLVKTDKQKKSYAKKVLLLKKYKQTKLELIS